MFHVKQCTVDNVQLTVDSGALHPRRRVMPRMGCRGGYQPPAERTFHSETPSRCRGTGMPVSYGGDNSAVHNKAAAQSPTLSLRGAKRRGNLRVVAFRKALP